MSDMEVAREWLIGAIRSEVFNSLFLTRWRDKDTQWP